MVPATVVDLSARRDREEKQEPQEVPIRHTSEEEEE
jgi:hypothetical protein